MTLWLVLAAMTAAAMVAILWPLGRTSSAAASGSDVVVYRDQLEEIERDRAVGRIGAAEAEAARVEISRRLIAAMDAPAAVSAPAPAAAGFRRQGVMAAVLIALPVGALGLYLGLGSPQLPGQPIADRQTASVGEQGIEALVARTEAYLERNPGDARGWEVLAPVYIRLGRFDDAVKARRNALALNGETAERQTDLGEALTVAANGVVTAEAKAAFERAISLNAGEPSARFYLGLAAEQDGQKEIAATRWRELLANAPADASWVPFVKEALARVEGSSSESSELSESAGRTPAPGPSAGDIAAATELGDEARAQMIRGMVERLAQRLQQDGSDVDGWTRLMRAYVVLGERERARAAANDARRAVANDTDKLRRVNEAIEGLGLGT